jgi:uncharacterized protein (DUF1697 family)
MLQYIALLRGINVGGNNQIEMKKLKTTFELLGFTNVLTYINSGNVIFSSLIEPIEKTIEAAIKKDFNLTIPVLLRTAKNIKQVSDSIPNTWQNNSEHKTDILFLWEEIDSKEIVNSITTNPEVDVLHYIKGAIVWHVDRAVYDKSGMHKFITTPLYKKMTARNINTVRKLVELLE